MRETWRGGRREGSAGIRSLCLFERGMASSRGSLLLPAVAFLLLAGLAASASASASGFISEVVFQSHESTGRNLLQAKKSCSINFEFMNYTIITSKCKGPDYLPSLCCTSFKEFACPYTDEINDDTTDCASTMFSYINLYGKYPPGLFASECKEGKNGLACPADSPLSQKNADTGTDRSAGLVGRCLSSVAVLISGFALGFLLY